MRSRRSRNLFPAVTLLEARRLLAATLVQVAQENVDVVGVYSEADTTKATPTPNDYQDIHLQLTGLSQVLGPVTGVTVIQNFGADSWTYPPTQFTKTAKILNNGNDIYIESRDVSHNQPPQITSVMLFHGSVQESVSIPTDAQGQSLGSFSYDINNRIVGRGLTASYIGQNGQDWTGPGPSVGTDGIQDIGIHLGNISAGTGITFDVIVTGMSTDSTPLTWTLKASHLVGPAGSQTVESGDPSIEMVNHTTNASPQLDSADIYISPVVNVLVGGGYVSKTLKQGSSLTVEIVYAFDGTGPAGPIVDLADANRINKTDTAPTITAGTFNPLATVAPSVVAELPSISATWQQQLPSTDPSDPGCVRLQVDAASLPTGKTLNDITDATLSDETGLEWKLGSPPGSDQNDAALKYEKSSGLFTFPPQSDENGRKLTLRVFFNGDPLQSAIATIVGQTSDPNLRGAKYVAQPAWTVNTGQELVDAINAGKNNVFLANVGTPYVLSSPLNLTYPITIASSGGNAVVQFDPAANPAWPTNNYLLLIEASHVTLNGFTISVASRPANWSTQGTVDPSVILVGVGRRDVTITNMNISGNVLLDPSGTQEARIISTTADSGGTISNNVIRGGTLVLRSGPWDVEGNQHLGPFPGNFTFDAFHLIDSHDDRFIGNHIYLADQTNQNSQINRFVTLGGGGGSNDLFQDNIFDGGAGQKLSGNEAEVIAFEGYAAKFVGRAYAISTATGLVLSVSGTPISGLHSAFKAGDVVTVLDGPFAGSRYRIAQVIDDHTFQMADPFPAGLRGEFPSVTISIDRGFIGEKFIHNTIDLRNLTHNGLTIGGDVALVLNAAMWDTTIRSNLFLGQRGISIGVPPTVATAIPVTSSPDSLNYTVYGWTHPPIENVIIDSNVIFTGDKGLVMYMAHDGLIKADRGRVYLTGSVTNNAFYWTSDSALQLKIGTFGFSAPWLDPYEIQLTVSGNTGQGPNNSTRPIEVAYATINGSTSGSSIPISAPASPALTLVARMNHDLELSWTSVLGAVSYTLQRSLNGTTWTSVSGTATSPYDDTGLTAATTYYYRVQANLYEGTSLSNTVVTSTLAVIAHTVDDFDGDGKSDLAYIQPGSPSPYATWYLWKSGSATSDAPYQFANNTDVPVPADYDGDGKTDIAVFRPGTVAYPIPEYIIQFTSGGSMIYPFGASGDVAVPGDYDGDGKSDMALFRPDTGDWFIHDSSTGLNRYAAQFGNGGNFSPVPADYDGDGKVDIAVFRTTTNEFFILGSSNGLRTTTAIGVVGTDFPISGDYDGDGKADIAVYRPSQAEWIIRYSGGGTPLIATFGVADAFAVPADYDGDGKTDPASYGNADSMGGTNFQWFIRNSTTGTLVTNSFGGSFNSIPLPLPPKVTQAGEGGSFPFTSMAMTAESIDVFSDESGQSDTLNDMTDVPVTIEALDPYDFQDQPYATFRVSRPTGYDLFSELTVYLRIDPTSSATEYTDYRLDPSDLVLIFPAAVAGQPETVVTNVLVHVIPVDGQFTAGGKTVTLAIDTDRGQGYIASPGQSSATITIMDPSDNDGASTLSVDATDLSEQTISPLASYNLSDSVADQSTDVTVPSNYVGSSSGDFPALTVIGPRWSRPAYFQWHSSRSYRYAMSSTS